MVSPKFSAHKLQLCSLGFLWNPQHWERGLSLTLLHVWGTLFLLFLVVVVCVHTCTFVFGCRCMLRVETTH